MDIAIEQIMAELTEEEYDALDEYYTKNPPKVNPAKSGTGFFTRRKAAPYSHFCRRLIQ